MHRAQSVHVILSPKKTRLPFLVLQETPETIFKSPSPGPGSQGHADSTQLQGVSNVGIGDKGEAIAQPLSKFE